MELCVVDLCVLFSISYGASDPSLSDRILYPHVFRMVQNSHIHNMVITDLLKYFGWTWVGILVSDDDSGENELQILTKYMRDRGICAAFTIKLTAENAYHKDEQFVLDIPEGVNIIIMCGTYSNYGTDFLYNSASIFFDKNFILPPSWTYSLMLMEYWDLTMNGSLAVEISSQPFSGMEDFFKNYKKFPNLFHYQSFWTLLDLMAGNDDKDSFILVNFTDERYNGSNEHTVPSLRNFLSSGVSPRVYSAVEVLGKALHEMFLFIKDEYEENSITGFMHNRRKLQRSIQMMKSSPDSVRPSYYFNEQGESEHPYKIINWLYLDEATHAVEIGNFSPWAVSGEKLHINPQSITWKCTNEIPVSRCSDQCLPGSRKKATETIHTCCYYCVPCSEGEISNITGFIFLIFITYRHTPIVKANNRNLSYVLLVSIILSFLSVFLFLGRPNDVTCRLRETSFGIFFSVAISSLLAKTVMVCVAFKSTKPGSPWRKWLSVKLPHTIVLLCSSLQVVLCVIWLSISPPFQDLDTQSYPDKIIIQCNEGSDICFYSMLGYMGLLSAVSFVLAFMVRTLPDSFNEAKYITFSMLLFCSVWISMIPAYLSTRGKYMVAVEIFAVIVSSAGLLACVFFPKCFIILFKSEMNKNTDLLRKRKE
ncbi:vomeronasal type-2 receptor 26-like [Eleutherodactylus coqui]|uniref:vomeronasal type-2 receptor 26-like n=1 Tax=Eleutherodactylus coqui TaxID=57060 RepID=UPI003461CE7A